MLHFKKAIFHTFVVFYISLRPTYNDNLCFLHQKQSELSLMQPFSWPSLNLLQDMNWATQNDWRDSFLLMRYSIYYVYANVGLMWKCLLHGWSCAWLEKHEHRELSDRLGTFLLGSIKNMLWSQISRIELPNAEILQRCFVPDSLESFVTVYKPPCVWRA